MSWSCHKKNNNETSCNTSCEAHLHQGTQNFQLLLHGATCYPHGAGGVSQARLARYFKESLRCSAYHGQVRLGGWSFMVHLQRQVRVHSLLKEIWEICIGIHCWVYDASRGNCAQSSQCLHMLTIKGLKGMQQSQVLWCCSSNLHVNVSTRGLHTQLQPTQAKTEYSNDQPPHSVLWAWQHPAGDEEDLSFAIEFDKHPRIAYHGSLSSQAPGARWHKLPATICTWQCDAILLQPQKTQSIHNIRNIQTIIRFPLETTDVWFFLKLRSRPHHLHFGLDGSALNPGRVRCRSPI